MQLRYLRSQAQTDICEVIRGSMRLDLGRSFVYELGDGETIVEMDQIWINAAQKGQAWSSTYSDYLDTITANLQAFVAKLQAVGLA